MIIQYVSDLHLEFPENRKFIQDNPLVPMGDTLILAGDIVPFVQLEQHQEFFSYISDHFDTTWWIPGNHEYYYGDIAGRSGTVYESIRHNVYLVNNYSTIHHDVRMIFSTLWSKINPENEWYVWQGLNDFRCISMADDYYAYTMANSQDRDGLILANTQALIVLKAKAYLNLLKKKNGGEHVDSKNIAKHKGDVFRLGALVREEDAFDLPAPLKADLQEFVYTIKEDLPGKEIFKALGASQLDPEVVYNQLITSFKLNGEG